MQQPMMEQKAKPNEIYTYEEALKQSVKYFNGEELSAKVFVDKYALRDLSNNILEATPTQTHRRLAKEFARIEAKKFAKPLCEEQIFDLFDKFAQIIPQGSPIYGIGNPYQYISISNCFVIDPPQDSYGSILKADEELIQISKRRGGVGIDLSNLRPTGFPTKNSSKSSTGTKSWMERYSNSIREVGQDGRRGALMETLSVHHPDIETFITIKNDDTKVTGANISVRLTDEFLTAVSKDILYEQRWPIDSKPRFTKVVSAKSIWDKIIYSAWLRAEPGLLFWDNILKESLPDCYAKYGFATVTTNPCITKDTIIFTTNGAKNVDSLIEKPFIAIVNGKEYPCNNGFVQTGTKPVFLIETTKGFKFKCTDNHKIHTPYGYKELSELFIGDVISLSNHSTNIKWGSGYFETGWLIGNFLGDGHYVDNTAKLQYWEQDKEFVYKKACEFISQKLNCRSDLGSGSLERKVLGVKSIELRNLVHLFVDDNKILSTNIEQMSENFYSGFLSGWFDADGTVNVDSNKGNSCRLSSIHISNLEIAQRMLLKLGIVSSIYKYRKEAGFRLLPDGNGGLKSYFCQANHELHISKENIEKFHKKVGFITPYKQNQLDDIIKNRKRKPNKESYEDTIKSIGYIGIEDVYDCTIDDIHEFDGNGVRLHNCSEIPLSVNDSCRLMAIMLFCCVDNPYTDKARFNYKKLFDLAKTAQRLMDDLIDLELECIARIIAKIDDDPESDDIKQREKELWVKIQSSCHNGRRTGLGITGLGDTLAALGIKYGSEKSEQTIDRIYKTLKFGSYTSSMEMAKELGSFPVWDWELERENPFLKRFAEEGVDLIHEAGVFETFQLQDELDGFISGKDLLRDIKKYGRRNIANLTTAPTGTISILAGMFVKKWYFNTTSGFESALFIDAERKKKGNLTDDGFRVDSVDKSGDKWMHFNVYHSGVKAWMDITGKTEIDESCPYKGALASDIDWKQRVKLQAIAQKHVDHAISSTINLPSSVTEQEVAEIYEAAWKYGLKGITIYRDGCRSGVITQAKTNLDERPKDIICDIHHITVKGNKYFVLVGLVDDKPYEVFAGKNGILDKEIKQAKIVKKRNGVYHLFSVDGTEVYLAPITQACSEDEEAITRLSSLCLRSGANMHLVVKQLEKVSGEMHSFAKSVARALKKYIDEGTPEGEKCPECSADLIRSEGCKKCTSCGYGACN